MFTVHLSLHWIFLICISSTFVMNYDHLLTPSLWLLVFIQYILSSLVCLVRWVRKLWNMAVVVILHTLLLRGCSLQWLHLKDRYTMVWQRLSYSKGSVKISSQMQPSFPSTWSIHWPYPSLCIISHVAIMGVKVGTLGDASRKFSAF